MKVLIHHLDQNGHAMLRFGKVEIAGVYDERPELQGRDAGEVAGFGKLGVEIQSDFGKLLQEADMLVTTGEGKYFTRPENVKEWREHILQAIEAGLDVYTMSKIYYGSETEELRARARAAGVKFQEASDPDGWKEYLPWTLRAQKEGLKVPRVLFAGTSMNSGKITSMMVVKEELEKQGVKVGTVGTEPCSVFLGIDEQVVPEVFPTMRGAQAVLGAVKKVEGKGVDLVLIGSQTGMRASVADVREARAGAVVAWQIALGSRPDRVVLCSKWDRTEEIASHIDLLEKSGLGKVVANVINGFGCGGVERVVEKVGQEFGLPCLDVLRMPERVKELVAVVNPL